MKFKARFRGLEFDLAAYLISLEDQMQLQLEEAAREWLAAVTGRVPLWSGMARGSLLKIAHLANGRIVVSPLKAKSRVAKGEILGDAEIKAETPEFYFKVSTRVPHYVEQESRNVGISPSAPWKSFEAGNTAALSSIQSLRLPNIVFKKRIIKRVG